MHGHIMYLPADLTIAEAFRQGFTGFTLVPKNQPLKQYEWRSEP
jgi:hypothetical protein